jgi:cysteine synthase
MARLALEQDVVDPETYRRTLQRFRAARIALPTFAQLADPTRIPAAVRARIAGVDPDAADAANLFRVHWWNDARRTGLEKLPAYVVLPKALTGVDAPILLVLGNRFPMIHAHKVLAAYACLVPRLLAGQFDPGRHRAVWPSTGNYCRGGVAISRIMGCRGVAVLPEGMSEERFAWLEGWVQTSEDIIRTPGTESNVKEIYDKCAELEQDPENIIFNQFSEFANHLAHYLCTGQALGRAFEAERARHPAWTMAAYVSASGSAGTLGAGDDLKDRYGARIVVAEALECPTLLRNGYGEHNIQGIGDKHVPLIHNVMNTDFVAAVSDRSTDALSVLFNSPAGTEYLRSRHGVPAAILDVLPAFGLSSICNILAAIQTAKYLRLGPDQVITTVATDGAELYESVVRDVTRERFGGAMDAVSAAETYGEHLRGADTGNFLELDAVGRRRVFDLGYYTWVEQQGVPLADFTARLDQAWWRGLRALLPAWDERIAEFNAATGMDAPD